MSKKLTKIFSFALVAIVSCFIVSGAFAQINLEEFNVDVIANEAGLNNDVTPGGAISNVIRLILALLGVVALLIIIIGGFKWMTSGGDSEKIAAAKKLMAAGILGMIIVLFAYIIQQFVVDLIFGAATGEGVTDTI